MNYESKDKEKERKNHRNFIYVGQKVKGYYEDKDNSGDNQTYFGTIYSIDMTDEKGNATEITVEREDGETGNGTEISEHPYHGERGWHCSRKHCKNDFGADGSNGELIFYPLNKRSEHNK